VDDENGQSRQKEKYDPADHVEVEHFDKAALIWGLVELEAGQDVRDISPPL
jgi:hypothetical protein